MITMIRGNNRNEIKSDYFKSTDNKYYATDIGLRYYLLGSKYIDYGLP